MVNSLSFIKLNFHTYVTLAANVLAADVLAADLFAADVLAVDVLVADVLAADTQNVNTRPITIKLQINHLKVGVLLLYLLLTREQANYGPVNSRTRRLAYDCNMDQGSID